MLCVSLFVIIRSTVTVSRISANVLATLISFDQRAQKERDANRQQMQGLIDRLMSGDWEAVRGHELAAETEPGGFFAPAEQSEEPTQVVTPTWGSMSTAQGRADALDEVEKLAREDDLDSWTAERSPSA